MRVQINICENLKSMGVFVFYTEVYDVTVVKSGVKELDDEIAKLEEMYKGKDPETLKEDPVVRAYRDFFWRIGIDPTKIRPSGEALRRRLYRGGKMPRINNVVDSGNIASLVTLVPIGLYDIDKIKGNLKIVMSEGNEIFYDLGKKDPERLSKGIPIMIDEEKKVLHIYPHRDSKLTSITEITKDVLVMGAGVSGVPKDQVKKAITMTASYIVSFAKGKWSGEISEA
ncbi:MAG: hypothetical protein JZD40_01930 [Sulfolobus sp.]|nr:hypothetical protein [Sulfolobus sp.]